MGAGVLAFAFAVVLRDRVPVHIYIGGSDAEQLRWPLPSKIDLQQHGKAHDGVREGVYASQVGPQLLNGQDTLAGHGKLLVGVDSGDRVYFRMKHAESLPPSLLRF